MNATTKTLIFALVAGFTSVVAAYYYPWPEAERQAETVGKPLFEDYESIRIRKILMVRFNPEKGKLEQFEVRRRGEDWILPGFKNIAASNAAQIGITVKSLQDREVLEERTDQQEDHFELGVIDPMLWQSTPNRSALGTKIILEDASRKVVANLIVGKVADERPNAMGEVQRFVAVPGQPVVNIINFDPRALNLDFKAWLDPNLLGLSPEVPIEMIKVQDSRLDPEKLSSATLESIYRTGLRINRQQRLEMAFLEIGEGDQWVPAKPTSALTNSLQSVVGQLQRGIQIENVIAKDSDVRKRLSKPSDDVSAKDFQSLAKYGFRWAGLNHQRHEFESTNGLLEADQGNGVVSTMYIGNIVADSTSDQVELAHYVIFSAGIDESILKMPPEPEKTGNAAQDEERNKIYLRLLKQRSEIIESGVPLANSLNERHAPWIYIVPNSVIAPLRPDLDLSGVEKLAAKPQDSETSEQENPTESDDDGKP